MLIINHTSLLVIPIVIFLLFLPQQTESCLPKWFRQERSAEPLEGGVVPNFEITNDVQEEDSEVETTTLKKVKENSEVIEQLTESDDGDDDEYELVDEFEAGEEEEESEEVKYNLDATTALPTSMSPDMKKKMEQWMVEKCTNRCENNATCSLEMYYQKGHGPVVIPVCHCPHGWEGERCERQYVQEFYAAISGSNQNVRLIMLTQTGIALKLSASSSITNSSKQSPSSAVPAVTFLVLMLIMFISIVLYAYKRMSRRIDETTYTMSHMCPPEAFTVLKTPCGRKISVHESLFSPASSSSASVSSSSYTRRFAGPMTSTPAVIPMPPVHRGAPQRTPVIRAAVEKPSLFQILRNQGSIPSRSINENDTPKQYKSVPRVEVSAINYSGHIDFSNIEYPEEESRPNRTSPPSHIAIEMEEESTRSTLDPTCSPIVKL